jgi:hypothetical protein
MQGLALLQSYADNERAPFFVMAEVNAKGPGGILKPMMEATNRDGRPMGFAAFHPVAQVPHEFPGGAFFDSKDGSCCYVLSEHYYNGTRHKLHVDDRWNATALTKDFAGGKGASVITSDAVADPVKQLEAEGLRNLDYFRKGCSGIRPSGRFPKSGFPRIAFKRPLPRARVQRSLPLRPQVADARRASDHGVFNKR